MKNTKRSFATVLFAFLILSGCTNCEQKKKDDNGDDKPKEEVKAPETIISLEVAKDQYDNYGKHRVPLIQRYEDSGRDYEGNDKMKQQRMSQNAEVEKDSFEVARYGYYDLETLKQYIKYIEQEAARANVEIANVRFYFSNYPDQKEVDGKEVVHPKQNSFFLIPTLEKGDRDFAFFIRGEGQNWHPVLLTDQLDIRKDQGMGSILNQDNKANASFIPAFSNTGSALFQGDVSLISNEVDMVPPRNNN